MNHDSEERIPGTGARAWLGVLRGIVWIAAASFSVLAAADAIARGRGYPGTFLALHSPVEAVLLMGAAFVVARAFDGASRW